MLPFCRAAVAQTTPAPTVDTRSWVSSLSHWGRWVTLAGAAGLTTVAIVKNHDADVIYRGLLDLCKAGGPTCVQNEEGTYINPDAETLYQATLRRDSEARHWMLGGQVMLAAAGTMFVIDLLTGPKGPKNIPFTPLEAFADGRRVGLKVRF